MMKRDWQRVELDPGVLREPSPDDNRIVVWLAGPVADGFQHWERISNVPGAEFAVDQGICTTPAMCTPARQKLRGFLGSLLQAWRKPAGPNHWLLPKGGYAEQTGERQTGLLLAWAEEDAAPVDAAGLRTRWEGQQVRQLGKNLYVVSTAPIGTTSASAAQVKGNPREQAEQLLAAARQAGDRRAEVSSLTDLAIAHLRGGDAPRAVVLLDEALAMARQMGDRARESDVLGNLGMAMLTAGQPARALELLERELALTRESGDRFEEKLALANLATVHAAGRAYLQALDISEQALALARDLGDRQQEADLLWFQAIQQAELGQREQAARLAQSAIDIYATLRSPHIAFLTEHLKKFRDAGTTLPGPGIPGGAPPGGYYTGATVAATAAEHEPPPDPGMLRKAFIAIKSMAQFVGSGMKTVPAPIQQRRLEVCSTCPHHTGVRCKLCGCFTSIKAWLPHEHCPIGKWPK